MGITAPGEEMEEALLILGRAAPTRSKDVDAAQRNPLNHVLSTYYLPWPLVGGEDAVQ